MIAKKDPRDVADEFSRYIIDMQTLLTAADDQVQFYLSNKNLLGPYVELLSLHATHLQGLLSLAQHFLEKMDLELDIVMDFLYCIDTPAK